MASNGTALVVGGGLGGLATAIRLQHRGWMVTLLEKTRSVGGRCNVLEGAGYTFDTGPTLLLMRDVIDDLFASVGRRLEDYLDLIRVDPNYTVHFGDDTSLTLSSNLQEVEAGIEGIEPGGAAAFRRYLADAGMKYRVSRERFVERNFKHLHEFATPSNLYYLVVTDTLRSLDAHARRYFSDERLVAALTFQTMYLGLGPSSAPAIYSLLPYTELCEGIWFPRGGMYRIAEAMLEVARELGVCVRVNAEVTGLQAQGRRVTGVETADGAIASADVVVMNADLPYAYSRLVPQERRGRFTDRAIRRLNYGSSALLFYLGLDCELPAANHHDVYLAADPRANFDAIFRRSQVPEDPSFYTCVASRTDRSLAPAGSDGLYVLVPVPTTAGGQPWTDAAEGVRENVFNRLERRGFGDLRPHVVFERRFTPDDFGSQYNILRGSAFGISHDIRQVGYLRPANKARDLSNLYFVGASTVPGGGVPMVVLGSRLTAERVNEDWDVA